MKRVISEEGRKALSDNMIKQNKLRKIYLPEELLRKYYLEEDLSINQIVEKYGIAKTTLVRRLKEYNIKKPKELINKKKSEAQSLKLDITKEELENLYIKENLSIKELCLKLDISKSSLMRLLKRYNIRKPKELELNNRNKTMINKYGVNNPFASDTVKEKIKQTNLKRYGFKNPLMSEEVKNIMKENNIKKYGVDNPAKLDTVKEKIKQTNFNRYGGNAPSCSNKVKEKIKQTNFNKYGVVSPLTLPNIKEKIKQTNRERYGVDYACQLPQAIEANKPYKISKSNKTLSDRLKDLNIPNTLEYKNFDIKVDDKDIVIEINPTYTHNSTRPAYFKATIDKKPLPKDYHLNKSKLAEENGLHCIHIFDWDDQDKIINMLLPKTNIYARKCELRELSLKETNDFLNLYHLQGGLVKQEICLGLYYKDTLVEIMTFGKPRYNKNYSYELLRLCSHKDYIVVGGTEKLFKYFIETYKPDSIISYCDKSKFSGDVYSKLGFNLKSNMKPSKHWYNEKLEKHITDNLLRQRGFDQLFGTNYGKGTSNEELMIAYGFVEVYDCGQATYIWKK